MKWFHIDYIVLCTTYLEIDILYVEIKYHLVKILVMYIDSWIIGKKNELV